jgi:hypothetical protein
MFDWRQFQRWGFDEGRLPVGSVVAFRTPSLWDLYKWYLAGGVTVVLLQSALIVGLLVTRAERRRAQRILAERLRFESLLSEVSAEFVTAPSTAVDQRITRILQRVVETLDLDRAALAERTAGTEAMHVTHSWTRAGLTAVPTLIEPEAFPWVGARLAHGDTVRIPRLDALPEEAASDRRTFAALGVRSLAAVPLVVNDAIVGALGFSRLRGERDWPDELMARLRMLADVLANVLARYRAESAVRESEARRRQAEEEAQRQRDELAHALRVATLGELTASIAHEINQPLLQKPLSSPRTVHARFGSPPASLWRGASASRSATAESGSTTQTWGWVPPKRPALLGVDAPDRLGKRAVTRRRAASRG